MAEAIDPDAPTVWWPCPECGGIHFRTTVVFERGHWEEISWGSVQHRYVYEDPPNGEPSGISADDVECVGCGHRFDIATHYGWPIVGEYEA